MTLSHYQCIDLTRKSTKVLAMTNTSTTSHMRLTGIPLPETSTRPLAVETSTHKLIPAVSWTVIGVTKSLSSALSIPSTQSTFVQEFNYSTPRVSVQLLSRIQDEDLSRNIILISTISAVTVLLVVAATLYPCVCRSKCFGR